MKTLRNLALALLVILLLPSCYKKQELDYSRWYTVKEAEDPTETVQGLMIMSSNVRFYSARSKANDPDIGPRDWENRKVGYFDMINTMRPQVAGLQEAEMNQVDDIIANCSGYAYIGVGRKDGKRAGESTSIIYRTAEIEVENWGTVWLSDTPDVPGSSYPEMGPNQQRTSTWAIFRDKASGRRFFHINSHTSLSDSYGDSRAKELQVILNTVKQKCPDGLPIVLTADWNMEQNDPLLKAIGDNYSNARLMAPITDDFETFHWWGNRNTIKEHSQLDHVFYGGFDKILKFRTLTMQWQGFWISDHHPVYAIFQLNAGELHPKPVVDFDLPDAPEMDKNLTFTDRSKAEGGISGWSWNIGGILSTEQNPTVYFNTFGDNISVSLTVTDNYGQKVTATKTMSIARSAGHDLEVEWSQNYDDTEGAYVYWTSPALNAAGDRIYVTSTGNHLVCFDNNGNQIGSYDIGEHGPVHASEYPMTHCCPTPSVDPDGNVYIGVQYGYDTVNGHGGFYSIQPGCAGANWYVNTGAKSQYEYMIPAIFDDKVAVVLRGADGEDSEWDGNMVVMKRSDHSVLESLQPDGGSYGGMAVAKDRKIVFSANKLTKDLNLGTGYKVGIPNGNGWVTSSSQNNGKRANLLSGTDMTAKGCQPAIAKDGSVYLCSGTNSGGELVCARYDLTTYQIVENGSFPKPIWKQRIPAIVARNGFGCVLDDEGNAYYMSGYSIFRLNKEDGYKAWEVALTSGNSGNCGVAAIDQLGYLYVCDLNGSRLLKMSSANGQIVSTLALGGKPRSCPTIAKDGSIYLTVNKGGPALFKISCSKTTGPGSNWSQLGANQQKTCVAPTE